MINIKTITQLINAEISTENSRRSTSGIPSDKQQKIREVLSSIDANYLNANNRLTLREIVIQKATEMNDGTLAGCYDVVVSNNIDRYITKSGVAV